MHWPPSAPSAASIPSRVVAGASGDLRLPVEAPALAREPRTERGVEGVAMVRRIAVALASARRWRAG